MAQGYYTLDEAAKVLHMPADELKQMARKGEIRAFQDRGTWRFRVQDIQELARRRGIGSDHDLPQDETPASPPAEPPAPQAPVKSREEEVFGFDLASDDEDIGVGTDMFNEAPSGVGMGGPKSPPKSGPKSGTRSGLKSGPKSAVHTGPRSPAPVSQGPKSPPPGPPGSDSDVRLVADGSDINFELDAGGDSDVGMGGPKSSPRSPAPRSSKLGPRSSGLGGPPTPRPSGGPPSPVKRESTIDLQRDAGLPPSEHTDSDARLVTTDSDSDVKIVGADSDDVALGKQSPPSATDSDIRLEHDMAPPYHGDEGMATEEINLDEERQKAGLLPSEKSQPPSKLKFPTTSPFELSEPEIGLPEPDDSSLVAQQSEKSRQPEKSMEDSSSDFELTPAGESSSPLDTGSDDFSLEIPDDGSVDLGASPPADLKAPRSGISLENPADSGISLEQGGDGSDEIEFELSLDADSTTPKPGPAAPSDSEFELTLDDSGTSAAAEESSEFELTLDDSGGSAAAEASSEFELTLEEGDGSPTDSDSEFELTLDDSGGLSPLAEEPELAEAAEQDIFEGDNLDVPQLEEESGSEAVAVDEETSDFDLVLGADEETADEEESGSEVVALDEEELDDDQPRRKAPAKKAARKTVPDDEEDESGASFSDLDVDTDEGDIDVEDDLADAPVREVVRERIIKPARWGVVPVLFLVPCVAVMFLVVLMGFELLQSMSGYKSPGLFTKTVGELIVGKDKFKN